MASFSIHEMTGFELQIGDICKPPKRASNNVKVLTAEDHTNKLSVTCKGDIKVFITILTTKKSLKRDEELGL